MSFVFKNSELDRIKSKYWNPKDSLGKLYYKDPKGSSRFQEAIVIENKDPDQKGRIKVHFPMWGENAVSDWIQILRYYGGTKQGFFALPEIGQRVLCTFINDDPTQPLAMGSFYNQQTKAPVGDNTGNNVKIITSPAGNTILLDDTEGAGKIEIFMKEGKMRLCLDSTNGITMANDLGPINIQCRKLKIETQDVGYLTAVKGVTLKGESITVETDKNFGVTSAANAVVTGKIDFKANGVLAEGKQIAKQDDQVVGVDKHDIEVPTPKGLQTVPMIPHPYMGKLVDKLSTDVTIGGKPAATKDSKSLNNGPLHLPMPPGVKFTKTPNNEGVVSNACIESVKINGKPAAVLGSKVTTCDDSGAPDGCQIIAVGAAAKVPIEIPVDEPIERSLENPKWSVPEATVGEKVDLSVQLKNQYENATVTFSIYPSGAVHGTDLPEQKIYGKNVGGSAEAPWTYELDYTNLKEYTEKPEFFFVAESFGCEMIESEPVTIGDSFEVKFQNSDGEVLKNVKYMLTMPDGEEREGNTGEEGSVIEKGIVPGKCRIEFIFNEDA